ncbi:MAG: hypothetical protein ABWY80_02835 [Acidimicrobiia bacterium]
MKGRRLAIAVVLAAVAVITTAVPASANTSTQLDPGAARILIISTPGVGWSLINEADTPNLWRLFQGSAIGNMTSRTVGRPDVASGYITIGAGNRAAAARTGIDGAGMEPTEAFGEVTARDKFALDTGRDVDQGVLQLGVEPIIAANESEKADVVVGRLGDDLARASRPRAVIGNGDGDYPDQPDQLKRFAVNALMGSNGVVPAGAVGPDLLEEHEGAPFGVRDDQTAVLDAFRSVWTPNSVVMVESSDLVRAEAFALLATLQQASVALRHALARTDALVGELLKDVDLARDAVIVVSPTRAREGVLSAVGVHAPGVPAGLVTSASTRRAGSVLLGDVAPTVLALAGLPRDEKMGGTRFTVSAPAPLQHRIDTLRDDTAAAVFRDQVRGPVTVAFSVLVTLLLVLAGFALSSRRVARWRVGLVIGALSVLAFVSVSFLARLVPLHESGTLAYWAFLLSASLVIGATAWAVVRRNARDALLLVLAVIIAVLVIDVVTGAHLQLSSAFGYSATVGIRVAGYGNVAYAMLSAATILVSALAAHRIGGRRGAALVTGLMFVVFIVDIAPFWGGDVGGVLSLVPAFGVTTAMLWGIRVHLSWRVAVIATTVTLLALAALTAFDLSRPADSRTHLGRLAQRVIDEGITPFTDTILRKLHANLATWSNSEWRLVLVPSLLFLVYLAVRERPRMRTMMEEVPQMRAALVGLGVLALLGYAFNDSGVMIPGAALAILAVSLVVMLVTVGREDAPPPPPDEPVQSDASTRSVAMAAASHE